MLFQNLVKYPIHYILFLLSSVVLDAQSIDTEFGKNRVQYTNDFRYWNQFETENFIAYWYANGKEISKMALQIAEAEHDEIRKLIEHKINDKIEIIVYRDQSELKQSNVGVEKDFQSKSGETKIVGTKMLIYYNGEVEHLRKQIREGIASVYLESLKFGTNLQEFLQNVVLLDLPMWFQKGLISYAGESWNELYDDELRDILMNKKEAKNFRKLAIKYPKIMGHSIWTYIGINYGKSSISDILYLTRITRDIDQSFRMVLNVKKETVFNDWYDFYKNKYEKEEHYLSNKFGFSVDLKKKKWHAVNFMQLNQEDNKLAFVTHDLGKIRIKVLDLKTNKIETIFKRGFKNNLQSTEYFIPQLSWIKDFNSIVFTSQEKDKIVLHKFDLSNKNMVKHKLPDKIITTNSIVMLDERFAVISAFVEGAYDLILYDLVSRQYSNITNDHFADLDLRLVHEEEGSTIIFRSNRQNDHIIRAVSDSSLTQMEFDVFKYTIPSFKQVDETKYWSKSIERLTSTEDDEMTPQLIGKHLYYKTNKSGIENIYKLNIENSIVQSITNMPRNVIRFEIANDEKFLFYETYRNGNYEIHKIKLDEIEKAFDLNMSKNQTNSVNEIKQELLNDGILFESNFEDTNNGMEKIIMEDEVAHTQQLINTRDLKNKSISEKVQPLTIKSSQITNAGIKFSLSDVVTRFDNEVLFEGLELFNDINEGTNALPMGFLAKAGIADIFNDYKIEGGLRIPTSLNGSEYFLIYDNNKNRVDKRISLYRRSFSNSIQTTLGEDKTKYETLLGMYRLKYPLNVYRSLRATASLRNDRYYYKVNDRNTLDKPIVNEKRIGLRIEYVYDNTFTYDINLLHGSRYKIYLDAMNQFNIDLIDGFNIDFSKGITCVFGVDARHYIPILDHMVFAVRGAGAWSFGTKKNLYMLGGVANSLFNEFDNNTAISSTENFGMQTMVNQMRGFDTNIRNGTSFAISNFELRIPFMKYILGKDKGSSIIRHLQIVGFADAGVSWYGLNPFKSKNPINTTTIEGDVIDLEIEYFRDAMVAGVGLGLRTKLLGYFIKIDYARGIETRQFQPAKWYISFGNDF